MGLFDFLSGSDEAERAAEQNRMALANYGTQSGNLYGQYQTNALGALGDARTAALGALNTGLQGQVGAYGQGLQTLQNTNLQPLQDALRAAQGTSVAPLQNAISASQAGLGAVQQGAASAADAGRAGVAAYAPLSQLGESYGRPVSSYYDALGLNGPEGVARAQSQFTTGPGYQFAVDEATRAAAANASRLGIAGSGNTLDEIRRRAQGFASGEYNQYLDRLGSFVNPQLQATSGAASGVSGANRTLADIYRQGGADIAGAYGNIGTGYGNLFAGQRGIGQDVAQANQNLFTGGRGIGQDIAGAFGQIGGAYGASGTQQAGLQTGYGQDVGNVYGNVTAGQTQGLRDITSGNIAANNAVAQAGQQDAANFWGLLGAGAKAAGGYFGSGR